MTRAQWAALLFLTIGAPLEAQQPDRWRTALRELRRLQPDQFQVLPAEVRRSLSGHGCTIPQTTLDTVPHNVVSGSFTAAGRREWAVLCSIRDTSTILILSATGAGRAALAPSADAEWLQGGTDGATWYSRRIARADSAAVRAAADRDGSDPTPVNRDGVSEAFEGKAGWVWYYSEGRWSRIEASD